MKVLLADDHPLFREGVCHTLLQLDSNVAIVTAGTYGELMTLVDAHPDGDVVLVDLAMPDSHDGSLEDLISRAGNVPIVVLSATEDQARMLHCLRAGAMGFIPKHSSAPIMLNALRLVLAGGVYVPPNVLRTTVLHAGQDQSVGGAQAVLTPRQIDVLRALALGKSNKEIGNELGLSEGTVKAHLRAIYLVLNIESRIQATRAAMRLGLVQEKREL
jgi:DNA-binding NarL/FixJ family response regulator